MNDKDIIMLFLDLEGTIIDEETGEMETEKIEGLLDELNRLEQNVGAKVNIHIVSPVFIKEMEKIMDKFDLIVAKYNSKKDTRLKDIQGAVAYPDTNYISSHDLYDKIFPMDVSKKDNYDKYGKLEYVKKWVEGMRHRIALTIYGGNGFNDTSAMDFVKRENNGFAICPSNSYEKTKTIANFVSDKKEADGITDGIKFINEQIEKRKQKEQKINGNEDKKGEEIEID